ncbi:MAG: M56 family metallopeptidase [Planctomycetes bacterium]|nr:M56 family metallopeptidase [Planctomycetota bacterium]
MSLEIWSVMLLDRSLQLLWIAPVAWLLERSVLRRAGLRVRGVLWGLVLLRTLLPVELHAWFEAPASLRVVSGNGSSSLWWFALIHVVGVVAIGTAGYSRHVRRVRDLTDRSVELDRHAAWSAAVREAMRRLRLRSVPVIRVAADSPSTDAGSLGDDAPCVVGAVRPRLFLPACLPAGCTHEDRVHVVLHELAHVERRDALRATVVLAFQLVFWFHPVVWYAASRLTAAREYGADAVAAAASPGGALSYGRTLVAWRMEQREPWLIALRFRPVRLARRIEALVAPAAGGLWRLGISCAFLVAAQVALAAHASQAGEDQILSLDEARGCFQKRYLVFRAMNAIEQASLR